MIATSGPEHSPSPIFVVGCPRSGNTLVGCLLNKHPELAIFFEQKTFAARHRYWHRRVHRRGADAAEALAELVMTGLRAWLEEHTTIVLSSPAILEAVAPASPDWGGMLDAVMSLQMAQAKPTANCWGDKSPQNVLVLSLIQRVYPAARFIYVYRDFRDTVASLSKVAFTPAADNPLVNAEVVRRYVEAYGEQKLRIDTERLLEVRYEDVVRDPERACRRICRFLQIDFDPAMLEDALPAVRNAIGWRDYKGWGAIRPQPAKLPRETAVQVEAYLHPLLRQWGYETTRRSWVSGLQAHLRIAPFRTATSLLGLAWKHRYPDGGAFVLPDWPSLRTMVHWLRP